MKNLRYIAILFIGCTAFSQSKYEQGMSKALDLWQNNQPWEAANLFERIATAEPDNWLPIFYSAQINVLNSFNEKDEVKLTAQLNKARDLINDAKVLSENNPEILVIEAQMLTAWIVFDGQKYGMSYSPKIAQIYEKAYAIAPDNPRVVLGKAEWGMGSAQFFGQPVTPYCKDIEKAIELFATFKPESEFHPKGGLDHAKDVINNSCKE